MKVQGRPTRTIELHGDGRSVVVIDQTQLPARFETVRLSTCDEVAQAIARMVVRGAPLIGVAGAFGLAFALVARGSDGELAAGFDQLLAARPTAVNLRWALEHVRDGVRSLPPAERGAQAMKLAGQLAEADVATCRAMAAHGLPLIERAWEKKNRAGRVNVLTHCNAGWLATVDWGTALGPVFLAQERGIPVHVWVEETRPRNQGYLTAWELRQQGIAHTVIVDNAGGHVMQRGDVDLCLVGTDRTARNGDVCNKIGTYLKGLAAHDTGVPFYVAAPSSSIDFRLASGASIPIEERSEREVCFVGDVEVLAGSPVANPGFDVTPARYVTGLVTERGVCPASADGLRSLFPEAMA